MEFLIARTLYPEKKGWVLPRPDSGDQYIFVHFLTKVFITQNGETRELERGACIFWDKHSAHTLSSPGWDILHDWFHATGNVPQLMEKYSLSFGEVYYPQNDEFVSEIIGKIEIERMRKGKYYREIAAALGEELIAKLSRECGETGESTWESRVQNTFVSVRQQIHRDYVRDWSVPEMAALAGLSPSRFYALYKKIFGVTPKKDLVRVRLSHAHDLLLAGRESVGSVAGCVGFDNVFHFIRAFREEYGITPGRFAGGKK